MARTPAAVSDDLFARLREHFDERQIVELTMAIALESLYNRSNQAFGIGSQGFSDGMYCAIPDLSANLNGDAAQQVESVGMVWFMRQHLLVMLGRFGESSGPVQGGAVRHQLDQIRALGGTAHQLTSLLTS